MNSLSGISVLSDQALATGFDKDIPKAIILHAGPVELLYESGVIRYLRIGEDEVVRMIYPALRDKEWNTIIPDISGENIQEDQTSFNVSYHARYNKGEIDFEADVLITGDSAGKIIFRFSG